MKHTLLLFATALLLGIQNYAQTGVAINPTGAEADSSAMLDVSSTTKGLLVPRMNEAQRTAIVRPVKGLLVYQNDGTEGFYYFEGAVWTRLSGGSFTETDPVYSSKFDLTGAASGDLLKFNGTKFVKSTPNFTESSYLFNSKYGIKLLARNDAQTNVDFVIQPKGTGAVLASQPDGPSIGGNNRGANAVDLQTLRVINSHVASGTASVIMGGYANTASGNYSTVSGTGNSASGLSSTAFGQGGNSNGDYSFGAGKDISVNGTGSVGLGYQNSTMGNYALATGIGNIAKSDAEAVFGKYVTNYTMNNDETDRLFAVGNGTGSDEALRRNAFVIQKNANTTIGGSLTINGNGTNTSYLFPETRGTSGQVLQTNGSGGTSWTAPAGGTVTGVTGTAPISSSGGITPAISISAATTSAAGSMSAADKAKLDKFPEGTASGQMLYWNGTTWVTVPNGTTGQLLSVNASGQPEWKSQLSIITASTLTPSMSSSGVTFNGVVNPNNLAAAQFFQYGTTTGYGNTTETTYYTPGSTNNTISSSQVTGLTVGATYHVRLVTQTILGTFYSNDITFTYVYPGAPLYLGASFQEGIVFYLDGTGQHGKVCAFYDQSASATWYDALPLCAAYSSGNVAPNIYDDWYLPSTNDLTLMYNNLKVNSAGSFSNSNYWSFEAFDDTQAFYVDFGNGNVAFGDKNATYKVRAVRDF